MNNDLRMKLESAYTEEINGYNKYIEWSKNAKDNDECKISKILKDMACEEHSHAKMLACLLGKEMS